ncbi:MAG: restriction endonuclease subunit S [Bacteroidales bacterium]|nr:restriction endonuclease subunit S [Bacteroidales bacterium]
MEWKEVYIKDICTVLGDGLHGTPEYDEKGDFYFINGNNLQEGHITIKKDTKRVSQKEFLKYQKELNDRTILVSINGTIGNVAKYNNEPCILGKSACFFNVKEDIDRNFIYYVISSPHFKKSIIQQATGTTIKNVSLKQMRDYHFLIPVNLSDQRKIAGILSALDSKIENNNKINANLEAQAQALFKSWFVDFTPFKDQPFVDSELGPIPQGWKVGKLGDYVEIKRGGSPRPIQKFLTSQGLNWLKISDATSTQSPFIFNIKEKIIINGLKKTVFLKAGSLVLSNSATPCIPKFLSIDSCIHDGWLYFPHSQLPKNYLYLFFKLMRNNLVSKANGSVFLNLKTDIVKNQVFAFSGEEIYNSFDKIIAPLFKEIENLTYETFQLSALRDTLLPKLMSGEIKL